MKVLANWIDGRRGPAVVFGDADLERAAEGIAAASFYHAGQDCVAAARVLVYSDAYGEPVDGLARRGAATKVGSAYEASTEMDPLVTAAHRDCGGGLFVEPTIVAGLRQSDELVQGEVFGPVGVGKDLGAYSVDDTVVKHVMAATA